MNVSYDADTSRVEAAQKRVSAGAKDVGSNFDKLGKTADKLGGVGKTMTRSVTLPIVALGAASVKAFADFDSAMTESTAIMGEVSDEMRSKMETTAREIAKTTKFSAAEAAEAYFFLASAGLDAEQSIAALPAVAAFAQAGMFDMAQATDLLTDAQSALGLTSADAEENLRNMARVSDVLVGANTLANASVEQFATALTAKAGTAMKTFGVELEDGVAVLARFADAGVKGEAAGTMYSRTLEGLAENARKNSAEFDRFGVSVFDANGVMRPTADIVRDMEKGFAGMTIEQKEAAIASLGFNKLAKQGLLLMLGGADDIDNYAGSLRDMGGVTGEIADKQMEAFGAKMGLIKDRMIDAGISIGTVLAPMLLALAAGFAGVTEKIMGLPGPVKAFVVGLLALAAVAGPALIITSKLIKAYIVLKKAMLGLQAGKAAAAFASMGRGAATAGSAMGRLAASAARATAQVVVQVARQVAAWVVLGVQSLIAAAKVALAWLIALGPIALVVAAVIGLVALIVAKWDWIKAATVTVWNFIKDFFAKWWPLLLAIFLGPIGAIVLLVVRNWDRIKAATMAVWNAIKGALVAVWEFIKAAVTTYFNIYRTIITAVFNAVKAVVSAVWNAIKGALVAVFNVIRGIVTTYFNAYKATITTVFNAVKAVVLRVWSGIQKIISGAASAIGGIIDRIVSTFGRILDILGRVIAGAAAVRDRVVGFITDMADGVIRAVKRAIEWFKKLPFVPGSPIPLVVDSQAAVKGVVSNFEEMQKRLPAITTSVSAAFDASSVRELSARVAAAGGSRRPAALDETAVRSMLRQGPDHARSKQDAETRHMLERIVRLLERRQVVEVDGSRLFTIVQRRQKDNERAGA